MKKNGLGVFDNCCDKASNKRRSESRRGKSTMIRPSRISPALRPLRVNAAMTLAAVVL
jgi:hypothetical protein